MTVEPPSHPPLTFPNGHFHSKGAGHRDPDPATIEPLPFPHYDGLDSMVEAMEEDGFVLLPNLLSREEVDTLRRLSDEFAGDDSQYEVAKWCFNRSIKVEWDQRPEFLPFVDRAPIGDLVRAMLGEDCRLRYGTLWTTGPGRSMPIHMDWQPVALPAAIWEDPTIKVPAFWIQVIFYLSDMHLTNGPTCLVPGSHKAGRPPQDETAWKGRAAQAAIVPAGSAVVFRSELWHGGLHHTADERRYIMLMGFGHSMLQTSLPRWRDELIWNPEVRERATEAACHLLGKPRPRDEKTYS